MNRLNKTSVSANDATCAALNQGVVKPLLSLTSSKVTVTDKEPFTGKSMNRGNKMESVVAECQCCSERQEKIKTIGKKSS